MKARQFITRNNCEFKIGDSVCLINKSGLDSQKSYFGSMRVKITKIKGDSLSFDCCGSLGCFHPKKDFKKYESSNTI